MNTYPEAQVVQKIFENAQTNGEITTGDITEIYRIIVNLDKMPKPVGIPQNIPNSSTDKFIGRHRELECLHQQLQHHNEVVIAAVEGMGGVGKTELAIQYSLLHLQLHNYPGGIFWLKAPEQDIGSQILNFARTNLGLQPPKNLKILKEQVGWCWEYWYKGNTLLVLDDVKDYSEIKPYLPPQPSQFKVLITTRLRLDLTGSLYVEVMPKAEAFLILTLMTPPLWLTIDSKMTNKLEKFK